MATQGDWLPVRAAQSREAYVARLFAAFFEAACRLDPARGRRVDCPSLPAATWETIAPHFGQAVDARLRARLQSAAGESLRIEIDRHARPALARLVALHAAAATAAG